MIVLCAGSALSLAAAAGVRAPGFVLCSAGPVGGGSHCHTRATVARVSCDACAMGSLFTCGDCACTPSFEWVLLLVLTALTVDLVWASLWMCMAAGCGAVDGARADAGSSRAG